MRRTYLFILCPAFSGSTILYKLLGTSPNVSTLFGHGNWAGEGQFVPAVRPVMRCQPGPDPRVGGWEDPAIEMPWDRIRREWERCWDLSRPVLVEKSPPNLLRAAAIRQHFSRYGDVRFVAMIRSPYHVRQKPELWLEEARHQRRNVETQAPLFWTTYEALCEDPAATARSLVRFLPDLGSLDSSGAALVGAGASSGRTGPIVDRNRTTRSLVLARNESLAPHRDLLRFFGYDLLEPGSETWGHERWLPEIELRCSLPVPPEEAYRAWTDPALLVRWWGSVRIDSRVGGEYSFARPTGPAGRPPVAGRFLELDPPRRLRFTWRLEPLDYVLDDTTVEVELKPVSGGGTRTTLRSLAVSRSWYEVNRSFWEEKLTALAGLW